MPANMIRVGVIRPPAEASSVTRSIEVSAPKKAPTVIPSEASTLLDAPNTITAAAPAEAPEDIPKM